MDPVIKTALNNAAFVLLDAFEAMEQVPHAAIPLHRLKKWHEIRRATMAATREIENAMHGGPPYHPTQTRAQCPDRASLDSCWICKGCGPFTWDPTGISWAGDDPQSGSTAPPADPPWAKALATLETRLKELSPDLLSPSDIAWAMEKEEKLWREAYETPCPECGASPKGEA